MRAGRNPPTLKRLGQHFLTDDRVVNGIADALDPSATDTVVEIGPGRGVLTDRLAARAGRVIAIELDRALAQSLRERYADRPHVQVVEADVLDVSLAELAGDDYLLAGNVPYYITTPILFNALRAPMALRSVFLVQREVAERVASAPDNRTYGALTVNVQAVAAVELVMQVPRGAFRPPPRVDSALIRITPLAQPLIVAAERDRFRAFVQGAFGLRRKQLQRVLRTMLSLDGAQVGRLLADLHLDPAARPETLSPAQFVRLFLAIGERER